MDAVYPAGASALSRGRRQRGPAARQRHRTLPVTFAEIKEVDEEAEGRVEGGGGSEASVACAGAGVGEARRRKPDVLEERLGRQFAEFRRRRTRAEVLRERDPEPDGAATARAGSDPASLAAVSGTGT